MDDALFLKLIFIDIILMYLALVPVFYFFLKERVESCNRVILSNNPRKRSEINESKVQSEKDIIKCFVWPILVIKTILDEIKRKK